MITKLFAIYDSKAMAYNNPIYYRTTGEALRAFATACQDPDSYLHKHPGDYTLFEIGSYDDSCAAITQPATPFSLGLAIEHVHIGPTPIEEAIEQSKED